MYHKKNGEGDNIGHIQMLSGLSTMKNDLPLCTKTADRHS